MPAIKNAPSIAQFVTDVKNLMLEIAARATAIAGFARIQSDTFKDATGINAGTSTGYSVRGTPNFDVIVNPGGTKESQLTDSAQEVEIFSNVAVTERGAGTTFQAASSYSLAGFKFSIQRLGSPTGQLVPTLYALSGGLPTGGALATAPAINVATLSTSKTIVQWTFASPVAIVSGTSYAIVLERSGAYTGDGANHVNLFGVNTNPYANGRLIVKSNADVWANGGANDDLYFETVEAAAASADIRQVTLTVPVATTQVILFADVTLNAGTATYYVSTDNGGTWTTVTAAQMAGIISVPSGTQLVARVVLTGNAELEHLSIASAT